MSKSKHPYPVEVFKFGQQLAKAARADGLSGLLGSLNRMIPPGCPAKECIASGDACMAMAGSAEEVWDCATDFASCLNEARWECIPEFPIPNVDERNLGVIVLAALIVNLPRKTKTQRTKT